MTQFWPKRCERSLLEAFGEFPLSAKRGTGRNIFLLLEVVYRCDTQKPNPKRAAESSDGMNMGFY